MYDLIQQVIDKVNLESISEERRLELQVLVDYIQTKKDGNQEINLNFICTHNSRRSQFSQVWAKVASVLYQIDINSYSGGVEETAFNERAIQSLERFGFKISCSGELNPHYQIQFDSATEPIVGFSKMFDDPINPSRQFAAIMTCSHADENCPFVAGCEKRIPVRYDDPKEFDDTPLESAMYDYRSFEIASEMKYVFSKIK